MIFGVPQYINVEDKIAGPLTARQLGWLLALGAILFVLWSIFEQSIFIAIAVPTILLLLAFAFYRPNGVSFLTFAGYAVSYIFRPKLYVWKRPTESSHKKSSPKIKSTQKQMLSHNEKNHLSAADLVALAQTLDSDGTKYSDRVIELIKQQQAKKKKK